MTSKASDEMEAVDLSVKGDAIQTGPDRRQSSRERSWTEKGTLYTIDVKTKQLIAVFGKLKVISETITSLMRQNTNTETVRKHYTQWLIDYENFLCVYQELCNSPLSVNLGEDKRNRFDEQDVYLKNFKDITERWFNQACQPFSARSVRLQPVRSRSRHGSLSSSVSAAMLRHEQRSAELKTKAAILKQKQDIELQKLQLKMREDELALNEQIAVEDAKREVLNKFTLLETEQSFVVNDVNDVEKSNSVVSMPACIQPQLSNHSVSSIPVTTVSQNRDPIDRHRSPVEQMSNEHGNVPNMLTSHDISFQPVTRDVSFLTQSVQNMGTDNVVNGNNRSNEQLYSTPHAFNPTGPTQVSAVTSRDGTIAAVVHHLNRPPCEIKRFDGDPFEYRRFLRQFTTKVVLNTDTDDDRLNFLQQFTRGEPNRIVRGFGYLPAQQGYSAALRELEERYGDEDVIANAFVKRTLNWQPIRGDNPKALDEFAIFLSECESAVNTIQAVQVLEYVDNMKKIVSKLPFYCHDKWRSIVHSKKANREQVTFHDLVALVKAEARKSNDPIYGRDALNPGQSTKKNTPQRSDFKSFKGAFATNMTGDKQNVTPRTEMSVSYSTKPAKSQNTHLTSTHPAYLTPCMHCTNPLHCLAECTKLSNKPYSDRLLVLKAKALCYGCLKGGHMAKLCRNRATCQHCSGRHPSVLHTDERIFSHSQQTDEATTQKEVISACADLFKLPKSCGAMGAGEGECTMAIIPVKVRLQNKMKIVDTYAFLDPGSSVSFCSDHLMRKLGGQGKKLRITLDTMGPQHTMDTYALDGLEVCSLDLQNVVPLPRVYTKDRMPVSPNHIPTSSDIMRWRHLNDLNLPQIDAEIELLIGNNVPDAYTPQQIRTGDRGSPHATKTLLGWIVWNVLRPKEESSQNVFQVNRIELRAIHEAEETKGLEKGFQDYINMDFPERHSFDAAKQHSQEDKLFLQKIEDSIKLVDGHYQINLPFRHEDVTLPENELQARDRLRSLKRKLQRDPKLHNDYRAFMAKIMEDGYAEEVPSDELTRHDGKVWYIPHHGVYHPKKPTKIRVVFDCSAKFQGISLNEMLIPGPNLTNSLLGVLLRFRQEEIAIMGDVEAMFHQVKVPAEDSDCLRFLWWPGGNLDEEPRVYRMRVHIFGAVSSPSCANSALRQTAKENILTEEDSIAAEVILDNFYVDDCLASCEIEDKAISLIKSVSQTCAKGGFRVTKWVSSSPTVIESIPVGERAKEVKELDFEKDSLPTERALGIRWNVEQDTFGFSVKVKPLVPTRRAILSTVSSVYDPLGFAAPYTLIPKILLQELCSRSLGWDTEISGNDIQRWQRWLSELPHLESVEQPRCYKPVSFGEVKSCDIHIFSDASNSGYGIVSYLRLINAQGQIHCCFVMAKARVAPLKRITIPRMELTAAVIAVRISRVLLKEIEYHIDHVVFWTDSTSVLKYIANQTSRFQTFVANRVSEIREYTCPNQWNFIDGKINPADAASRGLSMDQFRRDSSWFNGPDFLWTSETQWNRDSICTDLSHNDPEVKCIASTALTSHLPIALDRLISYHSGWMKLKTTVAWMLKGIHNLRKWSQLRKEMTASTPGNIPGDLLVTQRMTELHLKHLKTSKEKVKSERLDMEFVQQAETSLIRYTQQQYFKEDICALKDKCYKSGLSKDLVKLDPFLEDGLLRVGGRLRRAQIPDHAKFPILLPKDAVVSKLIIEDCHRKVGHQGKGQMLSTLRQKYWVLGANASIKTLLSKCVFCRKYRAKCQQQMMSDLPNERLQDGDPPFTHTGMDYFGPLEIKRGRSIIKRYGVIFTCLTTRAIHLEVAHSLDTDSCVNAIRRFISRRGPVKFMRSDNGTNLVGSQREMKAEIQRWNSSKIQAALHQDGISWEFNPPTASHFGGIWERMIRSTRKILHALIKEQGHRLNDESLQTLICEVEAIVNNRPLTELSQDPNDLQALTPCHLLHQKGGEILPPGLFQPSDNFARRRWRQIQYLADVFWTRWTREYLPLLQCRQKWYYPKRNITVDDVVLLMDSSPRNSWTLGRVVETFKDFKGLVRSVRVRTPSNILVRPITKLCLLLEANGSDE